MIAFVGNSSIDVIEDQNGELHTVIGGSSVNSSIAACAASGQFTVCPVSTVGTDFPLEKLQYIPQFDTGYLQIAEAPSNRFLINEGRDELKLADAQYLPLPLFEKKLQVRHLHISCRAGVPVPFYLANIEYSTLSIDVMKFSLAALMPEVIRLLPETDLLFCNDREFEMMQERLGREFYRAYTCTKFIVTERTGINIYDGGHNLRVDTKLLIGDIKSTTGAGDCFLGGFLTAYLESSRLKDAAVRGLATAQVSLTDFGTLHILDKKAVLASLYEQISLFNYEQRA